MQTSQLRYKSIGELNHNVNSRHNRSCFSSSSGALATNRSDLLDVLSPRAMADHQNVGRYDKLQTGCKWGLKL
jgi:hypothetical protein